ncbi:MAG: acetoacetate--CoA ligase [Candidatus Promineifilaceae bacterium]
MIWQPGEQDIAEANLTHYMGWLAREKGLVFTSYADLWRWSVDHVGDFWATLWDYFDLAASHQAADALRLPALADDTMPGAVWFPGTRLNYAENIFKKMPADPAAVLIYKDETGPSITLGKQELLKKTAAVAAALRRMGVQPGDRVVAYLPNIPEAVIAMLATASLGAVWSSCPPDFGSRSVLDRFSQIEPKVLVAVDGYVYGGKYYDRRAVVAELQEALPALERTILVNCQQSTVSNKSEIRNPKSEIQDVLLWQDVLNASTDDILDFYRVPFDHPLWILYSSGTTGLPKAIVQGHGGITLEHNKNTTFHNDLGRGDRFFWYSSTGWMMWNYLLGGLLSGCTIVLYNGSPAFPDLNALWRLAEELGITYFGTSAAFISACMKADTKPGREFDLSRIRALGSTGSPLTAEGFRWVYENVNNDLALESLSGGTDLCTAFVGGVRLLPIYAGEIQGPALGASVWAFNDAGEAVTGEVGELVITRPMPSMPLYFWNDPDMARYKASYFEMYPGVWRHGDWIEFNERGGCVIYGRSDSTINRQGIRMGTSEIYRVIDSFPEIVDSLIVDLELLGRESFLPLFVVMAAGESLDAALTERIKNKLRRDVSPRHVPDAIIEITAVPYTLSGKKMEVPVRRILLGHDIHKAVNLGAMRNPQSIQFFIDYAAGL